MSDVVKMPPKEEKSPAEQIGEEFKAQLELQFRRGLYMGVSVVTGAVNQEISKLANKTNKRLVDYQTALAKISRLCSTKLNDPDKHKEE